MSRLRKQNEDLRQENEQLLYTYDLAVEFSMDPVIVTLVDRYSRKFLKKDEPEFYVLAAAVVSNNEQDLDMDQ